MKILLIQPPVEDFYDTDIRLQPIGLASIKAVLKKYFPDINCKILDFHHGFGRQTIPIPTELSYLEQYYSVSDGSPFSTCRQFYRFGASDDVIRDAIRHEKPDLVGISSLFSPYYREVRRIASIVEEVAKACVLL